MNLYNFLPAKPENFSSSDGIDYLAFYNKNLWSVVTRIYNADNIEDPPDAIMYDDAMDFQPRTESETSEVRYYSKKTCCLFGASLSTDVIIRRKNDFASGNI